MHLIKPKIQLKSLLYEHSSFILLPDIRYIRYIRYRIRCRTSFFLLITMKKVIVLVGLPASGKSQFARELLLSEPAKWVRSNKDLLREMAHASHWSPANEKFILQLRDTIILMALESG